MDVRNFFSTFVKKFMEDFKLQIFLNIIGIGSASGILFNNNKLYIVSDNSSYLYEYLLEKEILHKIELTKNSTENILKKEKPDLESIALKGKKIYLFGSASTENRMKYFTYNLEKKTVKEHSLRKILENSENFNIPKDEINIEGTVFYKKHILFFQRGNGEKNKNGILKYNPGKKNKPKFIPITLPKINNINATFTDAILVKDKIYFLAAAENSNSTYNDGEIEGSMIGILDPETYKVEKTVIITHKNKMEGLTFFKEDKDTIAFLLCEDDDTEKQETIIYKLILNK